MKSWKTLACLLITAIFLSGILTGCAQASPAPSPAADGALHLRVCLAPDPESLDPALNYTLDGGIMLQHLFEGLMKYVDDGSGNAVLAMGQAEGYEKSAGTDGGTVYTFKLREDVFWSDGAPVTAGDFAYAWRRLADPATAASYSYMLEMLRGGPEVMLGEAEPSALGVSAPDARTLRVELTYDCPYFLELCAFPALFPVREDVVERYGTQWTFSPDTYISNGSYTLSEWTRNARIVMQPNQYYDHAGTCGPDSITFVFSDDTTAAYSAFRAGELDFLEGVPAEEADALTNAGLMKTADYLGTYFISFQNQRPPFDDPRVRKAFSLVIDSPYLTQTVTGTGEVPASAFVPPGVYDAGGAGQADFRNVGGGYWQVPLTDALYEENCRQARELLAQAGYPGGAGFPPVEYLYSTDQRNRLIAEALQSMWAQELGVRVTLVNQDWNSTLQTCFDGEYDMAAAVWTADYNDPISFLGTWQSEGGNNIVRYQSGAFDEALAQAATAQDAQARMRSLHRAEELLLGEDQALAPLYFYALTYCADPALKGIYYTPLGYFFFGQATRAN